jgi:hypothetical protein
MDLKNLPRKFSRALKQARTQGYLDLGFHDATRGNAAVETTLKAFEADCTRHGRLAPILARARVPWFVMVDVPDGVPAPARKKLTELMTVNGMSPFTGDTDGWHTWWILPHERAVEIAKRVAKWAKRNPIERTRSGVTRAKKPTIRAARGARSRRS